MKKMHVVCYFDETDCKMKAIVPAELVENYKVDWKTNGGQFTYLDTYPTKEGKPAILTTVPLVCTGDTIKHCQKYVKNHAEKIRERFPTWIECK